MIQEIELINVSMHNHQVGRLVMSRDQRCVFEYSSEWLRSGHSISPFFLPLEKEVFTAKYDPFEGLFGVFNDSLPDGWGNLLVDRWLRSKQVDPKSVNWLGRLALVGQSGMGALTYEPVIKTGDFGAKKSLDYYANEIEKILHEQPVDSLDELIEKAGSSGGARPKVLLEIDGKEWLIKFRAENDPKDIGELEYRYSQVAKEAGIIMPETRLFDGKYFGTVRFDRDQGERIHVLTASGLLHASHRYPSLDYIDLMKATFYLTRSINEVKKLYRLMVFNVLTFNCDDHAKNFSFIYKNGQWIFAPAYDLVYSSGFNGNHSTTIGGKGNPTHDDMVNAGVQVGINPKECKEIYEHVQDATRELAEEIEPR